MGWHTKKDMHFLSALCLRVFTRQVQVLSPCGHSLAGARLIPYLHAHHCAFGAALARCAGIQNWLTVCGPASFLCCTAGKLYWTSYTHCKFFTAKDGRSCGHYYALSYRCTGVGSLSWIPQWLWLSQYYFSPESEVSALFMLLLHLRTIHSEFYGLWREFPPCSCTGIVR